MSKLDAIDRELLNLLQDGIGIEPRPLAAAAAALGIDEEDVAQRIDRMLANGVLSRFGPMYDAARMGGAFTLCAMAVPAERFDEVAAQVNAFVEVAHNYERTHELNMWFVIATEAQARIPDVIGEIETCTGLPVLNLPKYDEYYIGLRFEV